MAVVNAGQDYRVTFVNRMGGQNGLNVKYFTVDTVSAQGGQQQEFADVLSAAFSLKYIACLSVAAQFRGVMIQQLGNILPQPFFSTQAPVAGEVTGDPLPPQTAGLVSLYGPGPKRRNHGRLYVPFAGETDNAGNGGVTTEYAANLSILGTMFVGTVNYNLPGPDITIEGRWYITGPMGGKVFIESRRVRAFWATQRRRSLLNRSDLVII